MVLDPAMPGTYVYDAEDRERFEQRRTVVLRIRFTEAWISETITICPALPDGWHDCIPTSFVHAGTVVLTSLFDPGVPVLSLWALDDGRFDRPIAYLGEIDVRPTVTTASGDSQDLIALAVRDDITPSNAREAWGRALVGDRVIEPRSTALDRADDVGSEVSWRSG